MEFLPQHFRFGIPPVIQRFAAMRNMEVRQENTHRVLRHTWGHQFDPLRGGREMFIGGIPHNCLEPELIPHLERFGRIYEFRLVMHSAWENRGYAYVKFRDPNFTKLVKGLGKFPIRPGCHLQVNRNVFNCNLLLIGVPLNRTWYEIFNQLNIISPGLTSVRLAARRNQQIALATGFGQPVIATYINHELTLMARNQIISRRLRMWGQRVHVERALQTTYTFPRNYFCSCILHVVGLAPDISDPYLFQIFAEQSNNGVSYFLRHQDQAFLYFQSEAQANMAKREIHAKEVNGNFLYVHIVRPTVYSTREEPVTMEAALRVGQGALEEDVPQ